MVQRQYGAIPSQVREQLASLERIVKQLLQSACAAGKTYIITNASDGWVQHSSTLCMPGLAEDLEKVRSRLSPIAPLASASGLVPFLPPNNLPYFLPFLTC